MVYLNVTKVIRSESANSNSQFTEVTTVCNLVTLVTSTVNPLSHLIALSGVEFPGNFYINYPLAASSKKNSSKRLSKKQPASPLIQRATAA